MTFNKPDILPLEEHREILRLFSLKGSQKVTQKEIKNRIDYDRMRAGTYTGHGISSNSISQRSPGSRHRIKHVTKQISRWGEWNVSHSIAKCLHCSLGDARDIYRDYILPISPFDFYDPNARNMIAIRIGEPSTCETQIYVAFTSEGYVEMYELDEDEDETLKNEMGTSTSKDNIWMVKTPFTYLDVLKGKVSMEVITDYLNGLDMGYEWIFLNTLINVG